MQHIVNQNKTEMQKTTISSTNFTNTKPHYELLDGLRGIAAILVLFYHIFEGFSFAEVTNGDGDGIIRVLNHGHIAVDFFFILSGFVISYAYDDRWKSMGTWQFFKRRLIRLHPMLVMGAIIGTIAYAFVGFEKWDGSTAPIGWVMTAMLLTMFMIPAVPGVPYEVRGNGEMFPLNGPSWSLFFEYIGNILYGIIIRRLSTKWLTVLCSVLGCGLAYYALGNVSGYGSIGVGWTIDNVNLIGGLLRMLFPFTLGMVLARNFTSGKIKGAFWTCSIALIALFIVPYIEGLEPICMNSIYEMVCISVIFPVIVWVGASGMMTGGKSTSICRFLGEISYPVYIVHYPIMYLFYAYLIESEIYTLQDSWLWVLVACATSIALAYACLKLYDIPMRKYLSSRFTKNKKHIVINK